MPGRSRMHVELCPKRPLNEGETRWFIERCAVTLMAWPRTDGERPTRDRGNVDV